MHLESVTLTSGQKLEFGRVNVIAGPNNVGKTTLLRELYECGTVPNSKWRSRFIAMATFQDAVGPLTAKLVLQSIQPRPMNMPGAAEYVFPIQRRNASGDPDEVRIYENDKSILEEIAAGRSAKFTSSARELRRMLWVHHSPKTRLEDSIFHASVASAAGPSPNALNSFRDDPEKLRRLQDHYLEDFGYQLVLDDAEGNTITLAIADPGPQIPDVPKGGRRQAFAEVTEWRRRHNYTLLKDAGDGIIAKTRLLLSLFEPLDRVLFIDEPEAHLYQKQRRSLGRLLVQLAKQEEKQVFVVVHDATFLQGAIDALDDKADVRLIRLTFQEGKKRVPAAQSLTPATMSSSRRMLEMLDVLFREGAILVEGSKDRAFYQEARDVLMVAPRVDLAFVSCWGLDRMDHAAKYFADFGIPYQCIVDFDALHPENTNPQAKKKSRHGAGPILDALCNLRGASSPVGYRETFAKALTETQRPGESGSLKVHGLEAKGLTTSTKAELQRILAAFASTGIHIVPNGAVESWVREAPPESWVEDASDRLRDEPSLQLRVRPFMEATLKPFKAPTGGQAVVADTPIRGLGNQPVREATPKT